MDYSEIEEALATPEERRAWRRPEVPEDRARSAKTLAHMIEEDKLDPGTPSYTADNGQPAGFDVPLRPFVPTPRMSGLLTMGSSTNVNKMRSVATQLRRWGFRVSEMDGWTTRGRPDGPLTANYVGCHHTAAEVDVDRILRDGRPDVSGPLCNWAVHKDGLIVLVASGRANHFGVATISSSDAWGIETTGPIPISNTGRDAFPNYRAYMALVKALLFEDGWPVSRVKGHKEVCIPAGRKVNPAFDMNAFRTDVSRFNPAPEEDDMTPDEFVAELNKQCDTPGSRLRTVLREMAIRGTNVAFGNVDDLGEIDKADGGPGSPARVGVDFIVKRAVEGLADDEARIIAAMRADSAKAAATGLLAALPKAVVDEIVARTQA